MRGGVIHQLFPGSMYFAKFHRATVRKRYIRSPIGWNPHSATQRPGVGQCSARVIDLGKFHSLAARETQQTHIFILLFTGLTALLMQLNAIMAKDEAIKDMKRNIEPAPERERERYNERPAVQKSATVGGTNLSYK